MGPGRVKFKLAGKWVERELNSAGKIVERTATWFARVGGKTVALGDNKQEAADKLTRLREAERLGRLGLVSEARPREAKPLAELVADWQAEKRVAGRNPVRLAVDQSRVEWLLERTGFTTVADLSGDGASGAVCDALAARGARECPRVLGKGETFTAGQMRAILEVSPSRLWQVATAHGIHGEGKGRAKKYTRAEAEALLATRRAGFSPATLNGYRVAFGGFCRWLAKRGLIPRVPYLGLRADERKDRRLVRRAVPLETIEALAKSVISHGKRLGGMAPRARALLYRVAFWSALRSRALRELTPADCRLEGSSPHLVIRPETDKTGTGRTAPIPPALAKDLAGHLRKCGELVFPVADPAGLARVMRSDLRRAGIPYRTPEGVLDLHAIRHSSATHYARKGVGLDVIAKIGGWSNLQQFFSRYGHYSTEALTESARRAWL